MKIAPPSWQHPLATLNRIPHPNPFIPWLIVLFTFLPLPPCTSAPLQACTHWKAFWHGYHTTYQPIQEEKL